MYLFSSLEKIWFVDYLGSLLLRLLNLLTFRGKLLNIFVTSDTTLVKWAANNPDLLAYSTTKSLALSTAINLSIHNPIITILELQQLRVSTDFLHNLLIILHNPFLSQQPIQFR
jgi:hypothetical protein